MDVRYREGEIAGVTADAVIVPVVAGDEVASQPGVAPLDEALDGELGRLAADARFTGKRGTTLVVPTLGKVPARRIVLAGTGASADLDADAVRRGWGAAAIAARDAGARSVVSAAPPAAGDLSPRAALAVAAEAARVATYRFTRHYGEGRKDDPTPREIESITFLGDLPEAEAQAALRRAEAIAAGVALARDLVNEPASVLNPVSLAEEAERVAAASGLAIEILGPEKLTAMGAGAIVAVGKGSANEPRLIHLTYTPEGDGAAGGSAPATGLVGKGITFDTGGYSIKPYEGMLQMKGDMAGGAATLAVMAVLRRLGCAVAVDATICAAENMISGDAFRPGDIIRGMNGVTIEILSTDAEGRLVLADGLVDAARRGATELIDLATLTGAIVVALGDGTTGLFSSDDRLAADLLTAAGETGERFWRMPLFEELNEKIKGDVGDIKNTGGRAGGAITAALFLQNFSEGLPWAHLDIAGSARSDRTGALGPKGGSGAPVRTLLRYLLDGGKTT